MDIKIKVIPNSSVNAIISFKEDILKVKVTAVPEKGLANIALINLLSKIFKIPKSSITVLKGKSSSTKIIRFDGMSKDDVYTILNSFYES
ncbi:MAG: DUF167 domain-containing protein [Parachlamydiaceae bacterium]|nr:DUF167 domain-containing protein [Parachlamydiaceae bacterium]